MVGAVVLHPRSGVWSALLAAQPASAMTRLNGRVRRSLAAASMVDRWTGSNWCSESQLATSDPSVQSGNATITRGRPVMALPIAVTVPANCRAIRGGPAVAETRMWSAEEKTVMGRKSSRVSRGTESVLPSSAPASLEALRGRRTGHRRRWPADWLRLSVRPFGAVPKHGWAEPEGRKHALERSVLNACCHLREVSAAGGPSARPGSTDRRTPSPPCRQRAAC